MGVSSFCMSLACVGAWGNYKLASAGIGTVSLAAPKRTLNAKGKQNM